ncbi:MAG TPA: ABC transporter substrate-binding protein [Burkholderiales bacterium]|jgi:ABC-type branched-subunit amino acid transport system substrate-binding protein
MKIVSFLLSLLAAAGILYPSAACADLVIVQVAPMTGPVSTAARDINAAAGAYFEKINAGGGINGERLRLITRDDKYEPPLTMQQIRDAAAEDKPLALLYPFGTTHMVGVVKSGLLDQVRIPIIGARVGAVVKHPMLFRVRAQYRDEIERIVEQFSTMGYERIGLIYQNDGLGKEGLDATVDAMARRNKANNLVVKAAFPANTTDVKAAVAEVAKAKVQGIIMVTNTVAATAIVREVRQSDTTVQISAMSLVEGEKLQQALGDKLTRGIWISQIAPNPSNLGMPLVREARDLMQGYGPKDGKVNFSRLEGLLAAKVIVEGLKRAGPKPDREKLYKALQTVRGYDTGGVMVDYSDTAREGVRYVDMSIISTSGKVLQ